MRDSRIRPYTVSPYSHPVGHIGEDPGPIGCFLAERYPPVSAAEALAYQVGHDRVARVHHIHPSNPADETGFTLFRATSLEPVTETNDTFGLGDRRVVPAITISSTRPRIL